MTLWQMMAAGALAVTLDSPPDCLIFRATIALLFLQVFITYLWWSVGIYDKVHRQLNRPYTISFLVALMLMVATLAVPLPYKRIVFWVALLFNYLPFLAIGLRYRRAGDGFALSSSMTERLGQFTIIVFGEAILGVINSVSRLNKLDTIVWLCFGMGIATVFAMWWIFFSIIADREAGKGMLAGTIISFIYIPTLASLGMVGAAFPSLLSDLVAKPGFSTSQLPIIFGVSIALFLCCVSAISRFLIYPAEYERPKRLLQPFLAAIAGLNTPNDIIATQIARLLLLAMRFYQPADNHCTCYAHMVPDRAGPGELSRGVDCITLQLAQCSMIADHP